MSEPGPLSNRNLAAAGVAFLGSGATLMIVGLMVMHSIPMAAGGAGLAGVGAVYLLRGAWRLGR